MDVPATVKFVRIEKAEGPMDIVECPNCRGAGCDNCSRLGWMKVAPFDTSSCPKCKKNQCPLCGNDDFIAIVVKQLNVTNVITRDEKCPGNHSKLCRCR